MDPQVGQLISNKYRLQRLIGDGGMGSVFEARHELLGTTVALKFLHNQLARRKGLLDRFLQEAQVAARIRSPRVASVSDVDRTPEGLAYMVMEFVAGETLQTMYERLYQAGERLSNADAFDIMLQMLQGVSAAHALAIVHRDLKPDNVMLSPREDGGRDVKILDFGIAKLKASGEADRGLTRPGVVMGTPEYMAPEQAFSADRVDLRADIFSLGVMFFEMLAGRRPVGGDNAHAIAAQYLEGAIANLRDLAPSLDPQLCEAVHQAMAAKPDQRFNTVDEFRRAILPFAPSSIDALADTNEDDKRKTPAPAAASPAGPSPSPSPSPSPAPAPAPGVVTPGSAAAGAQPVSPTADDEEDEIDPATELDGAVAAVATPHTDGDGRAAPVLAPPVSEFSPPVDTSADGTSSSPLWGPADDPSDTTNRARREAEALRGGTAGMPGLPENGHAEEAAQDPLRAGTAPMPPGALEAQGLRAGTEAMADPPRFIPGDPVQAGATETGATQAGGGYAPVDPGQHSPVTPHGASPYAHGGTAAAALGHGTRDRNKGPSFAAILLIAAALSVLVVGGVYGAHLASQQEDGGDDPIIPNPPPTQVSNTDDGVEPQPPAQPPVKPVVSPPPTMPPPRPVPKTQPPTQPPVQPPVQPPPPLIVLPSTWPPPLDLPIPGLGKTQPPSQPPPSQPPPTQPPPTQPPPQPPKGKGKIPIPGFKG